MKQKIRKPQQSNNETDETQNEIKKEINKIQFRILKNNHKDIPSNLHIIHFYFIQRFQFH